MNYWKFPKDKEGNQEVLFLKNATVEQLNEFKDHCDKMLQEDNYPKYGREVLLNIAHKQQYYIAIELCARHLQESLAIPRQQVITLISKFLVDNKQVIQEMKATGITPTMSLMADGLPQLYSLLPIEEVLENITSPKVFNRRYLSHSLIYQQGIHPREDRSNIKADVKESYRGVSADTIRVLPGISKCLYSEIPTKVLNDLYKILLPTLIKQLTRQVQQWTKIRTNIINELLLRH